MISKKLSINFIKTTFFNWKYFLIILIIASFNVNPSFLTNQIAAEMYFINFLRFFAAPFFSIYLIIYFLYKDQNSSYKKISITYENLILFSFFIVIFVSSLINSKVDTQIFYFLSYLSIFNLIFLLLNHDNEAPFNSLLFFILVTSFIYFLLILFSLKDIDLNLNNLFESAIFSFDIRFLGQSLPRSTGVSKGILIFSFLLFFNNIFLQNDKIKLLFIFIIGFLLFCLSSRTVLIFYIFIHFIYLILKKKNLKFKTLFLLFGLIIPFLLYATIKDDSSNLISKHEKKINFNYKNNLISDVNKISSGRINIWLTIINDQNFSILGEGILADKKKYNESSSNGFLYCYLAGGMFGLGLIILFKVIVLRKLWLYYKQNDFEEFLPVFIIFFIFFRFCFENGYALYNYELTLLLLSLLIINSKLTSNSYNSF